jgi:hypothetical protein
MDAMSACDGKGPAYPEMYGEACQTVSQMQYRYVAHSYNNRSLSVSPSSCSCSLQRVSC